MKIQVRLSVEKCMGTPFIFHEKYLWDIFYKKKVYQTYNLRQNNYFPMITSSEKIYNFVYSQKELKDKVLHMKNVYSNNVCKWFLVNYLGSSTSWAGESLTWYFDVYHIWSERYGRDQQFNAKGNVYVSE